MPVIDGTWTLPWMRGRAELLPGYEHVEVLFVEQERLLDAEEYEAADAIYGDIRSSTSLTFPDGTAVAEYLLHSRRRFMWLAVAR